VLRPRIRVFSSGGRHCIGETRTDRRSERAATAAVFGSGRCAGCRRFFCLQSAGPRADLWPREPLRIFARKKLRTGELWAQLSLWLREESRPADLALARPAIYLNALGRWLQLSSGQSGRGESHAVGSFCCGLLLNVAASCCRFEWRVDYQ